MFFNVVEKSTLFRFALALLSGTALASAVAAVDSWPQWRGPNRDAVSTEKGLLDRWEDAPPLLWKAEGLGHGYAGAAVDRGVVCTMGDRNGKMMVIAVNDENGKEIWATEIDDSYQNGYPGSRCTPTIDGERVYALSPQGCIACLKTATGECVWKKSCKRDFDGRAPYSFGYCESPLVDDGKLIFSPGGLRTAIVAVNKKTGEEQWRGSVSFDRKDRGEGASFSSIAVSQATGVKQYVQATGEGIVGIDAETGKRLWIYDRTLAASNMCTPIIRGDYVFVPIGWGHGSTLLKLVRVGSGVQAVEVYFIQSNKLKIQSGGAVLVGDHLYTSHAANGSPRCVEFLSGKSMWGNRRGPGSDQAAVAYADGHVYYRYKNGVMGLIAATPHEYQLKGRFRIPGGGGDSLAHPAVSNGRLYVREQNALYCYNVKKAEEGFVALFNGKDLSGFKTTRFPRGWNNKKTYTVHEGVLQISGRPPGYIYTEKSYKNYILRFDWKFPQGGNSGCFVHLSSNGGDRIEVQGAEGDHGRIQGGAFVTDNEAQKKAIKVGQWNTTEIISRNGELTSTVNGIQISTGKDRRTEGHIGFQSEGAVVFFKNIRIKVLH